MNKTILISIGLICSMIAAAGIMHHNNIKDQITFNREYRIDAYHRALSRDKNAIKEIRKMLNSTDTNTIYDAILFLNELADKESIPVIRRLLEHNVPEIRRKAIYFLGNMHDEKAIPEARKLLKDKDPMVKAQAAALLSDVNDRESIPELLKIIDDDELSRIVVPDILANFGDKESIPRIKELLNDEDKWAREAAERALKKLGVPEDEIEQAKQKAK